MGTALQRTDQEPGGHSTAPVEKEGRDPVGRRHDLMISSDALREMAPPSLSTSGRDDTDSQGTKELEGAIIFPHPSA